MQRKSKAKIKIINKSSWRTDDIKKIVTKAARQMNVQGDKVVYVGDTGMKIGAYHDMVRYTPGVSGRGRYGRRGAENRYSWLWIPKPYNKKPVEPGSPREKFLDRRLERMPKELARVAAHEFMHNQGVRHTDMTDEQRYCSWPVEKWPWLAELELRPKPARKKQEPKPKLVEAPGERGARLTAERAAHAKTMLKKAETRRKRAQTIERKWRAKVRYYERKEKVDEQAA